MRTPLFGATTAVALAFAARAEMRAPIVIEPEPAREELVAVSLTSNVFEAAREDYADLRIVDDAGRATPFVLRQKTEMRRASVRLACAAEPPLARTEGKALELVYVLPTNSPTPSGLTIDTPLRDFRQRVRVAASTNGIHWETLNQAAEIYGLERYVDVRATDVTWTPGNWRHYRVTFPEIDTDAPAATREVTSRTGGTDPGTAVTQRIRREPFRVDRVRFWRDQERVASSAPALTDYTLTCRARESRPGRARFVFRSWREPLTSIVFATPDRLFARSYRLFARDGEESWTDDVPGRLLASGMLTCVRFQDIRHESMTVAFTVTRCREYVLDLPPDGDTPAEVTVARAAGVTPQPVFVAQPGRRYDLVFGGVARAQPDAQAISALLSGNDAPLPATLGVTVGAQAPDRWRATL
ncbi:MAG: hypothetical protein PHR35_09955, partial [Kiritimatiellae bacterium]|nr:hypothetical protein [Kiritimatiellia bacterium]